jgi:hypothetical protein
MIAGKYQTLFLPVAQAPTHYFMLGYCFCTPILTPLFPLDFNQPS